MNEDASFANHIEHFLVIYQGINGKSNSKLYELDIILFD